MATDNLAWHKVLEDFITVNSERGRQTKLEINDETVSYYEKDSKLLS
jgi:hypothetical protein